MKLRKEAASRDTNSGEVGVGCEVGSPGRESCSGSKWALERGKWDHHDPEPGGTLRRGRREETCWKLQQPGQPRGCVSKRLCQPTALTAEVFGGVGGTRSGAERQLDGVGSRRQG